MKSYLCKRNTLKSLLAVMLLCFMVACSSSEEGADSTDKEASASDEPSLSSDARLRYQFRDLTEGDYLAEINVKDFGSIKVRLFPEYAPKAVQNFISLAEDGYYDATPIFRIIDRYLMQGGDPEGDGTGGESSWGTVFEDEFSTELQPFRGSLCMANLGREDSNGSQFFMIQAKGTFVEEIKALVEYKGYQFTEYLKAAYGIGLTEQKLSDYYIYGGAPWLYGHHTVFGQIYEGFDVLDTICSQEAASDYSPSEEILIESIEITQF